MKDSLFLKELEIHPDWVPFLTNEKRKLIASVEAEVVKDEFTPAADKVLRFLKVPLSLVKIIILGQDPYPRPGAATGRAFEVGTLQSWSQPFSNISLKNILRALYKAYTGKVIRYDQLKDKTGIDFPILPPGKLFEHWENQGVLLLNTSFTCVPGKPGSHHKEWGEFTNCLLKFISLQTSGITWFIWGNHAANATKDLQLQKYISTMHPMMCYDLPGRDNDFLFGKSNCFKPFIHEIDWTGYAFSTGETRQWTLF